VCLSTRRWIQRFAARSPLPHRLTPARSLILDRQLTCASADTHSDVRRLAEPTRPTAGSRHCGCAWRMALPLLLHRPMERAMAGEIQVCTDWCGLSYPVRVFDERAPGIRASTSITTRTRGVMLSVTGGRRSFPLVVARRVVIDLTTGSRGGCLTSPTFVPNRARGGSKIACSPRFSSLDTTSKDASDVARAAEENPEYAAS
jgi:hypothetical protein